MQILSCVICCTLSSLLNEEKLTYLYPVDLVESIIDAIDSDEYGFRTFMELVKAVDSVDHSRLFIFHKV